MNESQKTRRVVIIGGGFGGLYCAQALKKSPFEIVLVDKRNFHLFQPLLYQVATGGVSPGDITAPLRSVLSRQKNVTVFQQEVTDVDPQNHHVFLQNGETLHYDSLVVATGSKPHYFGNEQWASIAPGLKTIEDSIGLRNKIFSAFEKAEIEKDPIEKKALLTFVLAGGGPTGVEMAGALSELAHHTLKHDFKSFKPSDVRIILVEGLERILPTYSIRLSEKAKERLEKLGVEVRTQTLLKEVTFSQATIVSKNSSETIQTENVLWTAGVRASDFGKVIAQKTGAQLDKMGRLIVNADLTLPNHLEIFVIGDLAHLSIDGSPPLPGVAPVAMQQGKYVAKLLKRRLLGKTMEPFRYIDKGSLAVIGRNAAVARLNSIEFSGFFAWLLWIFVHLTYLIEFENKVIVLFEWAWNYLTKKRGARLITHEEAIYLKKPFR